MQGNTILAVDDDDFQRDMMEMAIQALGYEVETAENGKTAVDKFKAAKGGYLLVLLDLQMPVLDGIEAAKQIRQQESANGWKRTKIYGISAGFQNFK